VPNRFTRVPGGAVPPLPGWAGPVLPVADLFMELMLSRPASGTLRSTWVTPATLQLCGALAAIGSVLGVVLGRQALATGAWLEAAAGLVLFVLAIGAAAVAAVGLAQRGAG
jgi:hypothetical protein